MKKVVLFLFMATLSFANTLTDVYLNEGIEAVERLLEKKLETKEFWQDRLKDKDVSLGYYNDVHTVLVANKKKKTLQVFNNNDGSLKDVSTYNVIVGKSGDKQKEGDLKTPLGVYKIVRKFTPPDQFYGPFAYALSYPNIMDKVQGKNGYGIWIHGSPLDGSEREPMSKGCIVMENDIIKAFDTKIEPKNSIILVSEDSMPKATSEDISVIMASLYRWKRFWTKNDVESYLEFYSPEFKRFNGMGKKSFAKMKKTIFSRNDEKTIDMKNINISPYPNEEGEKIYKVSFYEIYKSKRHKFQGNKELYVKVENDKFSIVVEK